MNRSVNLFPSGFTQKSAQQFFDLLINAGVKQVVDTRLNNVSQLAGFTGHLDRVTSVVFSPDGTFLVSASRDTTIKVWQMSQVSEGSNKGTTGTESDFSDIPF